MGCPCTKSQLLSIPQLQALLRQAGWAENLIAKYSAITYYESCGGCATAYNKSGEYSIGLLQINMKAHGTKYGTEQQLYDPLWNLTQAYKIYKIQGDRAWVNSTRKYNQDLNGIATKARQIYASGGGNIPVNTTNTNTLPTPTLNTTGNTNANSLSKDEKTIIAILLFAGLYFLIDY